MKAAPFSMKEDESKPSSHPLNFCLSPFTFLLPQGGASNKWLKPSAAGNAPASILFYRADGVVDGADGGAVEFLRLFGELFVWNHQLLARLRLARGYPCAPLRVHPSLVNLG